MKRPSVTVSVARWSAARPGRALISWVVFVALCLGVGSMVGTNSATSEDYRVGEAGRAEELASEAGLQRPATEYVTISGGPQARAAADELTGLLREQPVVAGVAAPIRSANGVLMVEVSMRGPELEARKHLDQLTAQTERVQRNYPGLVLEQTGSASISKGVDEQRSSDLALSEAITFPVTLITLLVVFGSVLMAGVPLLLAITSIMSAIGLSMVVSHLIPDAGVGNNVIILIGMAVGVDYALFYLKREREERARGHLDPAVVVGLAAETAGRTVVVSGLAVIVSTATLYLATDIVFASLATGTITVVLVAVVSSITALPALLVLIGRRTAKRPAKPEKVRSGRLWDAISRPAAEYPVRTLCFSVLAMLLLALPLLGMEMRVLNRDSHSRDIPALQVYDRLTAEFPQLRTRHDVVVAAAPQDAAEVRAALADLGRRVQGDPLFGEVTAPRTGPGGRVTAVQVSVPFNPSSEQAARSLTHLRADYLPTVAGHVPGAEVVVTGDVARDVDYLAHQNDKLPVVVIALLLLTFAVTVLVFRSVVIGLVGVALNLLSAAGAMGLLVVFFQHGLATTLFGFDPSATSAIGSRVPLFLFVILFGLSMDYQMFVVSRIREAVLRGVPERDAVHLGVHQSAKVVTSAAVVMTTVFASFVFLHLAEMKQIGFSLAVAVLLDAFVIRVLILPSALTLLGRAAWWPWKPQQEPATVRTPLPTG
ncbi:putative drug exporter of the RND superfamily [Saccharopolyspora antimicrobica]|uniref:Putative drug exporter of the RND superfamily n=1 Tax=Saccharopolyspora antimicrobica TaxID=455193 RepID=A0A1I5HEK8_9PSEU|nr:MMPL family transporter [Saccharopolyspora antimicrobica]RKT85334.1 RND superfamily putative drug exporter [Saccharopolyspora antimicrobica]SFO46758.1 putative drug exporter of the RND superfamily [Saccharopolyspora antimicrobica]